MWQHETRCVGNLTAIIEKIQVEHTRRIWFASGAPKTGFDGLQRLQQSARVQIGLERGDRVDKPWLQGSRNRFGTIPRRAADNDNARCFELRECGWEHFAWRTISGAWQIAADSDQDHCAALMPTA